MPCPINFLCVFALHTHVIEAKYAYAVDRYLHLGAFIDADKVAQRRDDITAAFSAYRECYGGAYRCISAAHLIERDMRAIVMTDGAIQSGLRRVAGIVKREFCAVPGRVGVEKKRFLEGITPDGMVTLTDTVRTCADKVFELEDTYGLGDTMLRALAAAAMDGGHDIYTCWDPLAPSTRMKHLLIPSLSLAFVTMRCDNPYRRVRLDAYLDADVLARNKQKLKFLRRAKNALLDDAVCDLHEAKQRHDKLEMLYNDAVDFDGLYRFADELGDKLAARYSE